MERCPICRGRINDDDTCKRCGAELSLLSRTQADVEKLIHQAILAIVENKLTQAEAKLRVAQTLKFSAFGQNLLGLVQQQITHDPREKNLFGRIRKIRQLFTTSHYKQET